MSEEFGEDFDHMVRFAKHEIEQFATHLRLQGPDLDRYVLSEAFEELSEQWNASLLEGAGRDG